MANGLLLTKRQMRKIAWPLILLLMIATVFIQTTSAAQSEVNDIHVPKKLRKSLKSFEPSAALFLQETGSYLIASDDTTKSDTAMLFQMAPDGTVDKASKLFDGLEIMTDMESMSAEDGTLYVLSSQSRNKSGKVLQERNLFARSRINGSELSQSEVVELRPFLLKALANAHDARLQKLKPSFDQQLETEASFVSKGRLFIGLKDPQIRPGVALVLDLGSVDSIFQGNLPETKVAFELNIGGEHKLADMIADGDKFFITSTLEAGGGAVWAFDPSINELKEIESYSELKPEGISINKKAKELLVVFDRGERLAQFTKLAL